MGEHCEPRTGPVRPCGFTETSSPETRSSETPTDRVLDFALVGMGDPACDLIAAWSVLPTSERAEFREELEVNDDTWARGRGWALSIALIALPYYRETNPGFADVARHLIDEVLTDSPV